MKTNKTQKEVKEFEKLFDSSNANEKYIINDYITKRMNDAINFHTSRIVEIVEEIAKKKLKSEFQPWQERGNYKDGYLDAVENIKDDILKAIKERG